MDNDTKISFDRRELELIFAALDRYEKYLEAYAADAPVTYIKNEATFISDKVILLKARLEKTISLIKALDKV